MSPPSAYSLEGTLLRVCDCQVPCPSWIGEDPDNGSCQAVIVHHIERGASAGLDVSGLNWAAVTLIPGNVLDGGARQLVYVDEQATNAQVESLQQAFSGELGGPLADLAALVGETVALDRAPIDYAVSEGLGTLRIGGAVEVQVVPYRGPSGEPTTLGESIFSTIPGAPAWVAKALTFWVQAPEHGFAWRFEGRSAIQTRFRFAA